MMIFWLLFNFLSTVFYYLTRSGDRCGDLPGGDTAAGIHTKDQSPRGVTGSLPGQVEHGPGGVTVSLARQVEQGPRGVTGSLPRQVELGPGGQCNVKVIKVELVMCS